MNHRCPSSTAIETSSLTCLTDFSAVWVGIRALIPADGVERFKFCNGEEILRYIDRDNLPQFIGGSVPTPFRDLTPEEIDAVPVDPDIVGF